jgi:hypothetical protein
MRLSSMCGAFLSRRTGLVVMVLHISAAWAQPPGPPSVRCASVNVAGDVTLTWAPPADPDALFQEYRIYRADAEAGPYVPLPIPLPVFGQTSVVDLGTPANTGQVFYFMTTVHSVPGVESAPSDTVGTLFLELDQSVPAGAAELSWSLPMTATTANGAVSVWMEYPIGSWAQIGTTAIDALGFDHVISICEDSLTFRIGLTDALGCISFSNRVGDVFADVTPPSPPVITVVSVDTLSGSATIAWEPSPELDTDGYIILWTTPNGGVIQDTVYGRLNTSYTWPNSMAGTRAEGFILAAFDTCLVGVPPNVGPNTSPTGAQHVSIFLDPVYDQCGGTISLEWTPYIGWEVGSYKVYASTAGGPVALLGIVAGNATSYVHQVIPGITYCYVIRAERSEGTDFALSNKACLFTDYPPLPSGNYIRSVSVTGPASITVIDSVDVNAITTGYRLERSDNGGPYNTVATFPNTAGPLIIWQDEDVEPAVVGYRYRMEVADGCGVGALTSNVAGTMVLRATPDLFGRNTLTWNGYAEWAGSVSGYVVHRSVDGGPSSPIAFVPEPTWSLVDDVNAFTSSAGRFCYTVEAIEVGGVLGINATSRSNEACAVQEELVYIPNAMVIGGANPLFRPVLAYADVSEYELSIINRWGQVIWTTSDPATAWDGRVADGSVPIGIYAYYCSFRTGADRVVEERGTVTVLTAE